MLYEWPSNVPGAATHIMSGPPVTRTALAPARAIMSEKEIRGSAGVP